MYIKVNLDPLDSVASFNYLGRTIAYNNSKWVTLCQNLGKARRDNMGAIERDGLILYKAVVHMVLLYCSEIGISWKKL